MKKPYGIKYRNDTPREVLYWRRFGTPDAAIPYLGYFSEDEQARVVKLVPKKTKSVVEVVQDLALIDAVSKAAYKAFCKTMGQETDIDIGWTTQAKNAWCAAVLAGMIVAAKGTTTK